MGIYIYISKVVVWCCKKRFTWVIRCRRIIIYKFFLRVFTSGNQNAYTTITSYYHKVIVYIH